MRKQTKKLFIPQGGVELFIDLSEFGGADYFGKNVYMMAICSYPAGYYVSYPAAKRHMILICREGEFSYECDNRKGVLRGGEILILPAGCFQKAEAITGCRSIFFLLQPGFNWSVPEFRHTIFPDTELLFHLMEKARELQSVSGEPHLKEPLGKLIFGLLQKELHYHKNTAVQFQILRSKLQLAPHSDWSVEKMAEMCGVSVPYFFVLCRKYYNCSPYRMLKKLRLELAKELLQETWYSAKQIAEMCGYDHPSSLTRSLRKEYGCSAQTFRKKEKKSVF